MENFDLKTYAGRLAYAMHKAGKTNQSELARAVTAIGQNKVTAQTIQHLASEGKGSTHSAKLAKVLGVSPFWLETGMGDMQPDIIRESTPRYGANVTASRDAGLVPVISWVQAGQFCEAIDNFSPGEADEWLPCPTPHGPSTFALRVVGDSMTSPYPSEKSYPNGTVIYVDPDRAAINGSKVVARVPRTNHVTFKKYVEDAGKTYLMPLNPNFSPIEISEELYVCGVVIGSYSPE